jgi:Ca2+-binding RTX toxin-like protein
MSLPAPPSIVSLPLRHIGTEGNDFLQSDFFFGGVLEGRGGDDTLIGGSGSDTMDGGAGNDMLAGQDGDDVYLPGTGMDSIFEFGGTDELRLAAGIDPDQVERIRFDGSNDLVLRALGSSDEVRISNWFGGPENQVERVVFADGTVWSPATTSGLNQAPSVAIPIPDQSVAENAAFNLVVPPSTFSDPDLGDAFTLSVTLASGAPLPAWLSFDPATNAFSGTPAAGDSGTVSVRLTATDLSGASASDVFDITVGDGNDAPAVANPIADQGASENAVFSFVVPAGTFADPDAGDVLTLSARLAGGAPLPAWLSFDAATATFSGTAPFGSSGTLDVEVVATDGGGLSASDQFGIAIAPTQNEIIGTAGDDLLIGTPGYDLIWAGEGNDEVWGLESGDVIYADFTATPGDDTVYGGAGIDYIYGGGGTDLLIGGTENDVYEFLSPSTVVVEYAGEGHDEIRTIGSYALPANVEDLYLFGSAVYATGNDLDNFILATSDDNLIDGGAGADHMQGGRGNDTYVVDSVGDLVQELGNEGNDTILSSVTYSLDTINYPLHQQIENLVLTGTAAIDATGNALDNVLTGNSVANVLAGGGGNDRLDGGDGDDTLIGGSGSDVLVGGAGADTYVFSAADDTGNTAYVGPGDRLKIQGLDRSTLLMTRDEWNLYITVVDTGASIVLRSASGLPGEEGWRTTVEFGDGSVWVPEHVVNNSPYIGTNGDDVLNGSEFGDQIFGVRGNDVIHGNDGNDVLYGGGNVNFSSPDGDDLLDGGTGRDTMYGGGGNDRYIVDDVDDQVFEDAGAGIDTVESSVGYVLGATLENLTLTGTAANGSGNEMQNVLVGNAVANTLYGHGGDDSLSGMQGNDLLFGGAGNDQLAGGDGSDSLYGDAGDDVLDAGAGHDEMQGGAGNDTYLYSRGSGFDVAWEFLGTAADTDVVLLGADIAPSDISVRYTRPTQQFFNDGGFLLSVNGGSDVLKLVWSPTTGRDIEVEEVRFADGTVWDETVLAAMAIQNGDGPALVTALADQSATEDAPFAYEVPANAFDDIDIAIGDSLAYSAGLADGSALPAWLAFDAATRTFSGTPANGDVGAISVRVTATDESGRSASDLFEIAVVNTNDAPTVAAPIADQNARDAVAFSFTVPAGTFADVDTGDTLTYAAGPLPAWLSFDAATRTFTGTPGSANIGVTSVEVRATDGAGATVSDVFNIAVAPAPDRTITGTAGNDTLTGGSGNDTINGLGGADSMTGGLGNDRLDGGAGNDTMLGGAGDDTYVVAQSNDITTENANEGIDTVLSSVTRTLGNNLENLTLTGTTAINGTGNALNNVLTGNSASNTLNGGAGNDTLDGGGGNDSLVGGTGDDTYVVAQTGDVTTESANQGTDTVQSSIAWTLGNNLENLVLTGTAAINGTGNTLANVLAGNVGNNTLTGNAGNDTLDGQGGADTLIGGTGNDTYMLGRGYGADLIQENDASAGNTDIAQFLAGVSREQIWFERSGNSLVASIIGTSDRLTVQNWYAGAANRVEQFRTADGSTLLVSNVQNLVNAMAAFAPPAPGQETLPPDYAAALNPLIAANWQ